MKQSKHYCHPTPGKGDDCPRPAVKVTAVQAAIFIIGILCMAKAGGGQGTADLIYLLTAPSGLLGATHSPRGGSYLADAERAFGRGTGFVYLTTLLMNVSFWFVLFSLIRRGRHNA